MGGKSGPCVKCMATRVPAEMAVLCGGRVSSPAGQHISLGDQYSDFPLENKPSSQAGRHTHNKHG